MTIPDIKKIAVIGGGVIGSSWTTFFLWKGFDVAVYDVSDEALTVAFDRIVANLDYLAKKEIIKQNAVNLCLKKTEFTTRIGTALESADFIQEAAPENYYTKQAIVAAVDAHAPPESIFASSTSGLLISEIAKFSKFPERCIGAHPYNPPHLIPLVEINKGERTGREYIQRAYDFYKSIGKEPIILNKEAPGFISNRLQLALYREVIDLVMRGVCTVEDIDKAVCYGPGLRWALMGPNLIFHLGGGKVGLKGLLEHVGPSIEMWWADMADWKKWPEGSRDALQDGVIQEMTNLPPEQGRTVEEISRWRDDMLVNILRLLNRI